MQTIESDKNSQILFCSNMGPTFEILSYFTIASAEIMLNRLCKKTKNFYSKKKEDLFKICAPSVLGAQMEQLEPITNLCFEKSEENNTPKY